MTLKQAKRNGLKKENMELFFVNQLEKVGVFIFGYIWWFHKGKSCQSLMFCQIMAKLKEDFGHVKYD